MFQLVWTVASGAVALDNGLGVKPPRGTVILAIRIKNASFFVVPGSIDVVLGGHRGWGAQAGGHGIVFLARTQATAR